MPQCCPTPSHASVQHKQQPVGTDTIVQWCSVVNIIRQVNQQSVNLLYSTVPSTHSPSCSVNRTNVTWCVQYPGDFLPAMIPVSPLSPIAHHQAVAVSQCPADASAGSSWIPPGAQIWVFIQLPISMKLAKTELVNMLQVTREGRGQTQRRISFGF